MSAPFWSGFCRGYKLGFQYGLVALLGYAVIAFNVFLWRNPGATPTRAVREWQAVMKWERMEGFR